LGQEEGGKKEIRQNMEGGGGYLMDFWRFCVERKLNRGILWV